MPINWSQEVYRNAYRFAAEAHNGQVFPGTDLPYIMHISFVCMEVMASLECEPGRNGNLAIQCALLHDVIEDTDVTLEGVDAEFGAEVAAGVLALTKNSSLDKIVQIEDSLRRIQKQPYEVWLVKLADRISNLGPPPYHWKGDKIGRYRKEAIEIHSALQEASAYLSGRLLRKIKAYETYIIR
jgi:(p)ppGpp synthase/HD superfamily hydrolase